MAADAARALPVGHQATIKAHHTKSLICRFLVVMMFSHYYNLATNSHPLSWSAAYLPWLLLTTITTSFGTDSSPSLAVARST